MRKTLLLSVTTSSLVMAGAYKIPEQSINSMALGAAYVAHTDGADTAYYNPANMAFMEYKQFAELGLTLAHLPRNEFSGTQAYSATEIYPASNKSEIENLQLPLMHYVSEPIGSFRWGTSVTVPGGLTKRWKSGHQKLSAEEFTLKVIEFNPSASYKISDNFALGGGVRFIYSEGVVNSDGENIKPIKREMQGNSVELGYNLAMSYRPTPDINFAVTYRSNVDLDEEGEANLYLMGVGNQYGASVSVPLPASLNLAMSKTWEKKYTVELNYEKSYWSAYKTLDFEYASSIQAPLLTPFDKPKAKNWKDTDTYRVGFSAEVTSNVTFMAGYARDETPIDKKYISYELPDSNAEIYTLGVRIKQDNKLSYGLGYLHDAKKSFALRAGENSNGIVGEFSGGGADLVTLGMAYKF